MTSYESGRMAAKSAIERNVPFSWDNAVYSAIQAGYQKMTKLRIEFCRGYETEYISQNKKT